MKKLILALALFAIPCFAQSRNDCFAAPSVQVDFTGTTTTAVVSTGGNRIRVCAVRLTTGTTVDLTLNTTPQLKLLGITAYLDNAVNGQLATAAGVSLTVTVSASTHVAGTISYYPENQ